MGDLILDLRVVKPVNFLQPLMKIDSRNRQEGVPSGVSNGPMQLEKLSCRGGGVGGWGQFQVGVWFAQEGITWAVRGIVSPCGAAWPGPSVSPSLL